MTEPNDCRLCGLAYLIDNRRTYETPALQRIDVCCGVPQGEGYFLHVSSFKGTLSAPIIGRCKDFRELPGPPKAWPPVTPKMMHQGLWWTDVKKDAQRRLGDFA